MFCLLAGACPGEATHPFKRSTRCTTAHAAHPAVFCHELEQRSAREAKQPRKHSTLCKTARAAHIATCCDVLVQYSARDTHTHPYSPQNAPYFAGISARQRLCSVDRIHTGIYMHTHAHTHTHPHTHVHTHTHAVSLPFSFFLSLVHTQTHKHKHKHKHKHTPPRGNTSNDIVPKRPPTYSSNE